MNSKELSDYFKTLEKELEKDSSWDTHKTTDAAIIMIDIISNFEDISDKEKVLEKYRKIEDSFLDDCDWVTNVQTEMIAMMIIQAVEKVI